MDVGDVAGDIKWQKRFFKLPYGAFKLLPNGEYSWFGRNVPGQDKKDFELLPYTATEGQAKTMQKGILVNRHHLRWRKSLERRERDSG